MLSSCARWFSRDDNSVNAADTGRSLPDVSVTPNHENVGFSAANNQAIRLGTGTYVLALNPDTRVTAGALDRLVELMEEQPEQTTATLLRFLGAGLGR